MGNSGSSDEQPQRGDAFLTPQQMQAIVDVQSFQNRGGAMRAPPELQQTYTVRSDINVVKSSVELLPVEASRGKFAVKCVIDASIPFTVQVYCDAEEEVDDGNITQAFRAAQTCAIYRMEAGMKQVFGGTDPSLAAYCVVDFSTLSGEALEHVSGTRRYPIVIDVHGITDPDTAPAPEDGDAGVEGETPDLEAATGDGADGGRPTRVMNQTTYTTLDVSEPAHPIATVLRQKVQIDSLAYELQEIYGIDQSSAAAAGDDSVLCVVCLTNPVNTMCLPCRHMCLCDECANTLRMQSNKCPICRTTVETFIHVEIDRSREDDASASASATDTRPQASVTA